MVRRDDRPRLSREEILETSLRLLDEVGLVALSVRKLASVLDVTTPTLYGYFSSRQDLIDAMAGAVMTAIPEHPPTGTPEELTWDQWLAWLATGTRQSMLAHRDGALLVSMSRPTARRWADTEAAMSRMAQAGFPPQLAFIALATIMDFVIGGVLEEQQQAENGLGLTGAEAVLAPLTERTRPNLDPDRRFGAGVSVIIDGLRAQLARHSA